MYAAVDIGGTKTLVAVFGDDGIIIEQIKFPTSPDYQIFLKELADTVANLSTKKFAAGGVGIRGNIDRATGMTLMDDVLKWGHIPIKADCETTFNCPFELENDSKLAGLSEALLLKDKYRKVSYLTISTGIGSAFIVDGKLDLDTINSEVGKSIFEYDGKLQQWEDFASGRAIVAKYNKRASEIEDPETWREISKALALGVIVVIASFTPDVVVFGGGVGSHFDRFEKPLKKIIKEIMPEEIAIPPLQVAQRPEEAVIYGCLELAKQVAAAKKANHGNS
jgi:predicted NBD/HSP70 family sugar kinase